jgi:mono/diheme cytochrome c family protein
MDLYMRNLIFIFFGFAGIQLATSCDGLFKSKEKNAASRRANSQNAVGQRLYAENCASCHGDLNDSTKKQATAARILAAINSVPGMGNLRNLSSSDLDSIAAALNFEEKSKVEGAQLYASHCASCHGSLQKSQKLNKTVAQIKDALANQSTMQNIKLSDSQIDMIAAALFAAGSPSLAEGMPELRDRTMLASRLKRAFALSSQADRDRLNSIIDIEILSRPEAFSGNCSRTEAGSDGDSACTFASGFEPFQSAATAANPSLIRAWRLDRVCKSISAQAPVAEFVAAKVGGNLQTPPSEAQMAKFAILLSPGYELKSESVKTAFGDLMRSANSYNAETQWRLMIYGVCGSLVTEKL